MNQREQFACIGCSVSKVDALDKVLGKAVYAEDISLPNMLYGRVLRVGVPHVLIEEIDTSKAKAMKGVVCVLTAKDIPGTNRYGIAILDQEALAEKKVRFADEEIKRGISGNLCRCTGYVKIISAIQGVVK